MKFILLFGPPAVGKMTVGQELAKITGLKLCHNHMSLELANQFFEFSTPPFRRLSTLFRTEIFKEVANSDLDGMIFTFVWAFNLPKEELYVDNTILKSFTEVGADIYYVELEADLEQRLKRNVHPHRLAHKASKRNTKKSEELLLKHEQEHRFNTLENEFKRDNYLKINNTNLSPEVVAKQVKDFFAL